MSTTEALREGVTGTRIAAELRTAILAGEFYGHEARLLRTLATRL